MKFDSNENVPAEVKRWLLSLKPNNFIKLILYNLFSVLETDLPKGYNKCTL